MTRVGVIGLGNIGAMHVRIYSEMTGVELVGVADKDYTLAQDIAKTYGTTPFSDYKQLVQHRLDAVSIAVPTTLHKEIAVFVARAGVNMLVEKPIADTIEAAEEIIKTADDSKVKLMVGHIERFNPIIPIIKKEMEGIDIVAIEITRIGPIPPRIQDTGVIIDLATHDIDLIRYLTASEFKEIYSVTSKSLSQYEDTAILLFEMTNGVLGRVTVNWLTPFKVREISVASKEKYIKASFIDQKMFEYIGRENGFYSVKEVNVPWAEPLKLELNAFIHSVIGNTQPPITGEDSLRAIEVAAKCLVNSPSKGRSDFTD